MPTLQKYFFPTIYFFVIILRLIDSFKSSSTVVSLLGITSGTILFIFLVTLIVARLMNRVLLSTRLSYASITVGLFMLILTMIAGYINSVTYVNYIYSLTLIHIDQIFILSLFIILAGALSLSNYFIKNHYQKILFLLGCSLIFLYFWYGFFPLDARHQIAKEDHLIENFQAIFLFFSGILSLFIAKAYLKKSMIISILFFLAAVGLIFVAGDEISWGQRILRIATPEYIGRSNAQNEITVHNYMAFHGSVHFLFLLIGIYGSIMFIVYKYFGKTLGRFRYFYVLIPPAYLFPFFFAGFLYNFVISLGDHTIGDWSEPTELMLYLGVFFYMLITLKMVHHRQKKK